MLQIRNRKELVKKLKDQPPKVAATIALRIALRSLPVLAREIKTATAGSDAKSKHRFLPYFRAIIAARFVQYVDDRERVYAYAYAAAAHEAAVSADEAAGIVATDSIGRAISAAAAAADAAANATRNSDATFDAGFAAEAVARAEIWQAVEIDVTKLYDGAALKSVLESPLWPIDPSKWTGKAWADLSIRLLAIAPHWQVWIDWYNAILEGKPAWGLPRDRAEAIMGEAVLWPDDEWKRGPDHINPRLQALVEAAKALPEQDPTATRFKGRPREPIRIAPRHPGDGLTDTPEQRDWHGEIRQKIADIKAFGPNELGPNLAKGVDQFSRSLGRNIREGRWVAIWSSANTLRSKLAAHDKAPKGEPDPAKLKHDVAESLRDLVETYNQFVIGDEKLSARDAQRLGPQERETVEAEVKLGKAVIKVAVKTDRVFDLEAREELQRHLANADAAGKNLHGDQALEQSRKTMRNAILEIAKTGRDEIRHALRKTTEGVYSEAGKTIFTKLKDNPSEVVTFISQNGQALIDYATQALHSPALVNIVEQVVKLFGG